MPPSVAAQQRFHAPWRHGRRSWFSPHGVPGTHLDPPVPQALRLRSDSRCDRSRTAPVSAPGPAAGSPPVAPSAAPAACCVPRAVPAALSGPGPLGSVPGAQARSTLSAQGQCPAVSGPGSARIHLGTRYRNQPRTSPGSAGSGPAPRRRLRPPSARAQPFHDRAVTTADPRAATAGFLHFSVGGFPWLRDGRITASGQGDPSRIRPDHTVSYWSHRGHTEARLRLHRGQCETSQRPQSGQQEAREQPHRAVAQLVASSWPLVGQNLPKSGPEPASFWPQAHVWSSGGQCWSHSGPLLASGSVSGSPAGHLLATVGHIEVTCSLVLARGPPAAHRPASTAPVARITLDPHSRIIRIFTSPPPATTSGRGSVLTRSIWRRLGA